jgi:DNA-binding beta-propeller fold protein YncE
VCIPRSSPTCGLTAHCSWPALGSGLWARLWALGLGLVPNLSAQAVPPTKSYLFFVASEGSDQVALIRFGPKGSLVEHRTPLKIVPGDPAGQPDVYTAFDGKTHLLSSAHGFPDSDLATGPRSLALAPNGRAYYVTTAHGFAGGELLQVRIAADSSHRESQPPDTVLGQEPLSALPGAVAVTPDGGYAWVTSSAEHGTTQSGWVAVIYLGSMVEVARIPTCAAPVGSRLTADGAKHYSVCTQDDALVEIDARAMKVARRLPLGGGSVPCSPTWAEPNADGSKIYVACSGTGDVAEIDGTAWHVLRRIPMGGGISRLALTHDGKLLIGTSRRTGVIAITDVTSGRELARLQATRSGVGDVAVSADDRYAFVAVAGSGAEPGAVEVIDLGTLKTVTTVDVGPGAGGIVFWKEQ